MCLPLLHDWEINEKTSGEILNEMPEIRSVIVGPYSEDKIAAFHMNGELIIIPPHTFSDEVCLKCATCKRGIDEGRKMIQKMVDDKINGKTKEQKRQRLAKQILENGCR